MLLREHRSIMHPSTTMVRCLSSRCVSRSPPIRRLRPVLRGEIVQMGDVGNFQINVGSRGVATAKEFKAALIRKPRIVFRPGVELKEILDKVSFERIDAETGSSSGGNEGGEGEDDRPVIE